jgi:hypothetical protein
VFSFKSNFDKSAVNYHQFCVRIFALRIVLDQSKQTQVKQRWFTLNGCLQELPKLPPPEQNNPPVPFKKREFRRCRSVQCRAEAHRLQQPDTLSHDSTRTRARGGAGDPSHQFPTGLARLASCCSGGRSGSFAAVRSVVAPARERQGKKKKRSRQTRVEPWGALAIPTGCYACVAACAGAR